MLRHIQAKGLRASTDILIVQSRLHAPSYAGPGRWMIIQAAKRKSFLAAGADVIPPAIEIIANANTQHKGRTVTTRGEALEGQLAKLESIGILTRGVDRPRTLTELYHLMCVDYPFRDYSTSDWREKDLETMLQYARMWPPPPSHSEYDGRHIPLPKSHALTQPGNGLRNVKNALIIDRLAFLLEFVFGAVGEVPSKFLPGVRRTSPSGGARHPTDALIELVQDHADILSGSYAYEAATHNLVRISGSSSTGLSADCFAKITLRSTVERAMWRYRDIRAFRPLVLDAGHIAEMISIVAAELDFQVSYHLPSAGPDVSSEWLAAPPLLEIRLKDIGDEQVSYPCGREARGADEIDIAPPPTFVLADSDREFLTNPFAHFMLAKDGLVGRTAWPSTRELKVNSSDFLVFNHCIPSQRGDRIGTMEGIVKATGISTDRIRELFSQGLLVDRREGESLYRGVRLWARYGWYLSLLKVVESRASYDGRPLDELNERLQQRQSSLNFEKLVRRKTCREFSSSAVDPLTLMRILDHGLSGTELTATVAPFAVEGTDDHLHRWSPNGLVPTAVKVTRDEVAKATTGQFPSAAGAFTVWLIADITPSLKEASAYETRILSLGMAAHRMCVCATQANLGVFLTPALSEGDTLRLLGIEADPATRIGYLLSIGRPLSGEG